MNTPTPTTATTPSFNTPTAAAPFVALDFLQQFVVGINDGVVFRTANGSPILSTIKEADIVAPAEVHAAFDIIDGYFKSPGLSSDMDVNRTQQLAVFLAEIIKHQHRQRADSARFTAYELGNAVAALQAVLKPQTPTGKN